MMRGSRIKQLAVAVFIFWQCGVVLATQPQDDGDTITHNPLPYIVMNAQVDQGTYTGWRVFHSNCYTCHGIDAVGSTVAPDLTQRISGLSFEDFTIAVLYRYPIIIGNKPVPGDDLPAVREAFLRDIKTREKGGIVMPVWSGNQKVQPHLLDLFAYLRARADGVLGPGEPQILPQ